MRRGAALLLAAWLTACSSPQLVTDPPPPERVEVRPPRPGPDHFWQSGHWSWDGSRRLWFWTSGGWERERPGWIWVAGHWRPVEADGGRAWEWVPERWVRLSERE